MKSGRGGSGWGLLCQNMRGGLGGGIFVDRDFSLVSQVQDLKKYIYLKPIFKYHFAGKK